MMRETGPVGKPLETHLGKALRGGVVAV